MIAIDGRRMYVRAIHGDVQGCHTVAAAKAYLDSIDEPVALKAVPQKTIVFDSNFELKFSTNGVTENPSGTSSYNPSVIWAVMYNTSVSGDVTVTDEADDEIAAAAEISEEALLTAIKKHYRAEGRAKSSWDRAMGDEDFDGDTPW